MNKLVRALCVSPALVGALTFHKTEVETDALADAIAALEQSAEGAPDKAVRRFEQLSSGEWDPDSMSGPGSRPEVCKPFVDFFLKWLGEHKDVQSMVEVSAGHWPTGWQRLVQWPAIDYTGIDLLSDVIDADKAFVAKKGKESFGLKSMLFQKGDMLNDTTMPKADLLFTKDTLIHFPNKYIQSFINTTVLQCPPKYKYVMFVHDLKPRHQSNKDIEAFGMYHGFNLSNPPFSYKVSDIFSWMPEYDKKLRSVQLIDTAQYCQ